MYSGDLSDGECLRGGAYLWCLLFLFMLLPRRRGRPLGRIGKRKPPPADGIRRCQDCGVPLGTYANYPFSGRCLDCRRKKLDGQIEAEGAKQELARARKLQRLEKAKSVLTGKTGGLAEYQRALKAVAKHLHRPGWFQSVGEVVAALELLRQGYKLRHQAKVLSWRVDFIIPELKIVLEVDGFYHANRKEEDAIRDSEIQAHLGPEWEIVRVKDRMILDSPQRLLPAMHIIVEERKKYRRLWVPTKK